MFAKGLKPELGGYLFHVSPDQMTGIVAGQTYFGPYTLDNALQGIRDAKDPLKPPAYPPVSPDMLKFDDWRLPTKEELNMIFEARNEMQHFGNQYYWSSTSDHGGPNYWRQYIGNGTQNTGFKDDVNYVVLVRDVKNPLYEHPSF